MRSDSSCRSRPRGRAAPRRAARPLRRPRTTALIVALRRRRFALLGEASHGSDEFYRERAAHHPAADRRAAASTPSRSRPTGPTPTASIATSAAAATTPTATRRSPASSASRPGCGATPSSSTSSTGCATTTPRCAPERTGRLLRPRPVQPVHARSRRCSPTSTASTRRRRAARAIATPASSTSPRTARPTATRPASTSTRAASTRSSPSCARWSRAARRELARHRRRRAPTPSSTPSRTRAWCKNAEAYYRTMFRARVSSWNLRDRHMAETLAGARRPPVAPAGRPARIVVWAHNSHLGDARATEMGERRRAEPRPAGARAARRGGGCCSASAPTSGTRHGGTRLGRARPRRKQRPARRCRAATRTLLPRASAASASCCSCAATAPLRRGARGAAAAARHRRHLPAGDRAPEPLFPRPAGATSSTRSSTSTRRARWCRSTRRATRRPAAEPPETYPSGV